MPDPLPPLAETTAELLAARHRLGERVWTMTRSASLIAALRTLEQRGLAEWKVGTIENTVLAWLTAEGKSAFLDPGYIAPEQALSIRRDELFAVAETLPRVAEAFGIPPEMVPRVERLLVAQAEKHSRLPFRKESL